MQNIPDWIIQLVGPTLGTILGYFLGKRKEDSDLRGQEIAHLKELFATWQGAFNEMKLENQELRTTNDQLQKKLEDLQQQYQDVLKKLGQVERMNEKLEAEIEQLRPHENPG